MEILILSILLTLSILWAFVSMGVISLSRTRETVLSSGEKSEFWKRVEYTVANVIEYNGTLSTSILILFKRGYLSPVSPRKQLWLHSPSEWAGKKVSEQTDIPQPLPDGNSAVYKVHLVSNYENFDKIIIEMSNFLLDNRIYHKFAPGYNIVDKSFGVQYGKVATIYASDKSNLIKIVNKGKELASKGYSGINLETFQNLNANLQYELPVPGTNNIIYYTIERFGRGTNPPPVGYPARKFLLEKYWGKGPLDHLWSSTPFVKEVMTDEKMRVEISKTTDVIQLVNLLNRVKTNKEFFELKEKNIEWMWEKGKELLSKKSMSENEFKEFMRNFTREWGLRDKIKELSRDKINP